MKKKAPNVVWFNNTEITAHKRLKAMGLTVLPFNKFCRLAVTERIERISSENFKEINEVKNEQVQKS